MSRPMQGNGRAIHGPQLIRGLLLCESGCTIEKDDDTDAEVCGDPTEDATSTISDEEDL